MAKPIPRFNSIFSFYAAATAATINFSKPFTRELHMMHAAASYGHGHFTGRHDTGRRDINTSFSYISARIRRSAFSATL